MDFIDKGLSTEQVHISRAQYGLNMLKEAPRRGLFRKFLENFGDPIIKILLVAFFINLIFAIGDNGWYETVGIALAILLATWVSTISMYKSEAAFKKLQEDAANISCRVIRDGKIAVISVAEVVVGDAVLLQSGDKVPADGEIIGGELDLNQSVLNGETVEAHKTPHYEGEEKGLKNKKMLFSGSVVSAGEGVMRVTEVGDSTFLGQLAQEIQQETRESPLKLRLTHLAGTISKFGTIGAALVALSDLFNTWLNLSGYSLAVIMALFSIKGFAIGSLLHAVTLAVTVIVVAVPEGLPMMITVVLSANMRRMLKDKVLVRTMVGIETAGNTDVLFTDKTGTLTMGQLRVKKVLRGDGVCFENATDIQRDAGFWNLLHTSLTQNNASSMVDGVPAGGNTTDRALLAFAAQGSAPALRVTKAKVIPFTSAEKYMATEVRGDRHLTLIKGAFERILPHCTKYIDESGQSQPLKSPQNMERRGRDLAKEGMRIIAVATTPDSVTGGRFSDLTFVALIGIQDPLRDEAKESVEALTGAGIQVVMITGDSLDTAKSIAQSAGLLDDNKSVVLTSAAMEKLSDRELMSMLPNLRVVARALPGDKSRLVEIAQQRGSVVGMTGDGVNDAPALKKADVGFAMGSGTEVAKEAGDIVILNDNLSSIVKAVLYGRTIFKTIRKFIVFQLTVNLCAVLISIIAPLIGYDSPVTVLQMLWINMVMDTLAGMAFSGEPALLRYLKEKPLKRDTPVINREMAIQIGVMSAITTCLNVWFLLSPWAQSFFRSGDHLMTAFFAMFMYAGIFNSVSARTDRMNLFSHLIENKSFVLIMAFVFLAQTAIIYLGGSLFRAYGLTFSEWLVTLALAALVLPADLIRKLVLKHLRRLRP